MGQHGCLFDRTACVHLVTITEQIVKGPMPYSEHSEMFQLERMGRVTPWDVNLLP